MGKKGCERDYYQDGSPHELHFGIVGIHRSSIVDPSMHRKTRLIGEAGSARLAPKRVSLRVELGMPPKVRHGRGCVFTLFASVDSAS